MPKEKHINNRAVILSEFGGYLFPIEGHKQEGKKTYKSYTNLKDWILNFEKSFTRDVLNNIPNGLAASIYTQLSDVEDELNGFVTFDREVIKFNSNELKKTISKAKF